MMKQRVLSTTYLATLVCVLVLPYLGSVHKCFFGVSQKVPEGEHVRLDRGPAGVVPAVADKCVFILATGRSASTALLDAVNQLPAYLIRGEQENAFWNMYQMYRDMNTTIQRSQFFYSKTKLMEIHHRDSTPYPAFDAVKATYTEEAVRRKLPWFNDLHANRIENAMRSLYAATYGYHGQGYVSGFKEIRYGCGGTFATNATYGDFEAFVSFLRTLCLDVKLLLNSRREATLVANKKLFVMIGDKWADEFVREIAATHSWYDRYAKEHNDHAMRVHMEDMYDPKENATLASHLLSFLGEDPMTKISFTRMPGDSKPGDWARRSQHMPQRARLIQQHNGSVGLTLRSDVAVQMK